MKCFLTLSLLIQPFLFILLFWGQLFCFFFIDNSEIVLFKFLCIFFRLLIPFFSKSNKLKFISRLDRWNSLTLFELFFLFLLFSFDLFKKILLISSPYRFKSRSRNLSLRDNWVNDEIIMKLVVFFLLIFLLLFHLHLLNVSFF